MGLSFKKTHTIVERFVHAKGTPALPAGLAKVIDLMAAETPHTDWAKLRALDLSHEVPLLRAWFEVTLAMDPPDERVHGLFFDVCQPGLQGGGTTADIALSGTRRSRSEDPDEWLFTQFYRPLAYACSPFLDELYGIAYGTHARQLVPRVLGNDAEYPLGLAYGVLAARAILDGRTSRDVPRASSVLSIAAGFGEGDIALVGALTPTGFTPNTGPVWS
jgi:hypothetical protein